MKKQPGSTTIRAPISSPELSPQQIEIKQGGAKGSYQIHPVACLFPLLSGKPFEDLKKSIEAHGQQDPIVIDGQIVLDGRNRLNALNQLGRAPKIVRFVDLETSLTPGDWIAAKNLQRRNLTDDQRLAIATKYQSWLRLEQAQHPANPRTDQTSGRSDGDDDKDAETEASQPQGADNSGGSEFPQEPAENASKRKKGRPRGGRSDAEAVAAKTKMSRYKAERMLKLQKQAPALFKAVEEGQIDLKEAIRQLKAQQSPKTARPRRQANADKIVKKATQMLAKLADKLEAEKLAVFWKNVAAFSLEQAEANGDPGDNPTR